MVHYLLKVFNRFILGSVWHNEFPTTPFFRTVSCLNSRTDSRCYQNCDCDVVAFILNPIFESKGTLIFFNKIKIPVLNLRNVVLGSCTGFNSHLQNYYYSWNLNKEDFLTVILLSPIQSTCERVKVVLNPTKIMFRVE